ncbi:MAG: cysteine desulfurase [Acidobacteria bacterium]|nr:cysteine desulfurase [Acidobacteriota bacterium]MYC83709.1 cysteine desulfurase [Acidobacteriota bacterium]
MRRIYLDNNATTRVAQEVLEAMLPCYGEVFGNPSSVHGYGQEAKEVLDLAREQVAALLNSEPNEIVFTGGGTESDNLAIRGVMEAAPGTARHLVTSQIEHHAVIHTCQNLEKRGVEVTYLPVGGDGVVDPEQVARAVREDTRLISIMVANNETGTLQPVRRIGEIARERGVVFHSDAVQAAGKIPLDTAELGVDLLTISAHKFHGPKGVGALFVRKGTRLRPLFYGGGHERNRRAGTENVPQIVGLGRAAELAGKSMDRDGEQIRELRDWFEQEVQHRIPEVSVNGRADSRLCNTSNLRFAGAEAEGLIINLDLAGVACSTGSACSSGAIEPSHVLTAMGLSPAEAFECLRFSLSRDTSREDLARVLDLLPDLVARQREMSSPEKHAYSMIS